MQLAIVRNARRINIGKLPRGDAGVSATVAAIQALVDDATYGESAADFRRVAARLRGRNEAANAVEFARELYDWLVASVEFFPDPRNVELVRHPSEMLSQIETTGNAEGDCDDLATLAAAIIAAAGFRPVVVTVGRRKSGRFEHIFAGVRIGAGLDRESVYALDSQERTGAGKFPPVPRVKLWSLTPSPIG